MLRSSEDPARAMRDLPPLPNLNADTQDRGMTLGGERKRNGEKEGGREGREVEKSTEKANGSSRVS